MRDKEMSKYDEGLTINKIEIGVLDHDEMISIGVDSASSMMDYYEEYISIEEAKEIIKFLQHQIDKAK